MRILIVDDSALVRTILKEILKMDKGFSVAGEAANGQRGVEMAAELKPDLIIMDINMPVMNGLEATRYIMEKEPVPILILSTEIDAVTGFKAIQTGACEVMKKPEMDKFNEPAFAGEFFGKLRHIAASKLKRDSTSMKGDVAVPHPDRGFKAVVIGASTGGPMAIRDLLKGLPVSFPLPILVVQHLETGFDAGYTQWLKDECSFNVKLCTDNTRPLAGEVIVAPTEKHMVVKDGRLFLDEGPKVLNQRPSVDVLFESAAAAYGSGLIGVLLTGMGRDGANGLLQVQKQGGRTIAQDEASSAIFGMPKAAIDLKAAGHILNLKDIPHFLARLTGVKS
jgi:two-component system, chemotaxis family, protein-glutamate methylesterase/glutaminase